MTERETKSLNDSIDAAIMKANGYVRVGAWWVCARCGKRRVRYPNTLRAMNHHAQHQRATNGKDV